MLSNLWIHCPTFNITLGCSPANPFIRTWGGMLGLDFHIILVLYSKLQPSWESALKISFQKFTFTALSQFRKVHLRNKSREMLEFFPAAIVKIVTKGDLFRTKNAPRKMQNRFFYEQGIVSLCVLFNVHNGLRSCFWQTLKYFRQSCLFHRF